MIRRAWGGLGLGLITVSLGCQPSIPPEELGTLEYTIPKVPGADRPFPLPGLDGAKRPPLIPPFSGEPPRGDVPLK